MSFHLFQAGSGAVRDAIFVHYLGITDALAAALRVAAPEAAILIDTQASPGATKNTVDTSRYTRIGRGDADGILSLPEAQKLAQKLTGGFELRRTIACGFSAGGQGVRTWLDAGQVPDAAVICDGWHAATAPGPMLSRRAFVARALLGEAVLALSHTQIVPPTYSSTRATVAALTGWCPDELTSAPVFEPTVHHDVGLRVESYSGATGADHGHQAGVVFPALLTQALAMLDGLGIGLLKGDLFHGSLGEAALLLSLGEMRDGVHEVPDGSNTGPRIRPYLAGISRGTGAATRPLDLQAAMWCSAAAGWSAWTSWAKLGGSVPPHGWRASVAEDVADARASGAWHPKGDGYVGQRGDLAVFGRAGGSPSRGGTGHIARPLEAANDAGRFRALGGNEENMWKITARSTNDPAFEGWIAYPG